jgi:WD40 repeat protein
MYRRSIAFCSSLFVVAIVGHGVVADDGSAAKTDSEPTWVTSIVRLGSSDQFVAATADGLLFREASVCSFNAATPNQLQPLYAHPAAVWCVDATSDGAKVASVDYRGNLVVFDTASSKPETHEKAFERWCQAMMVAPDDQSVLAGNEAGKIMIWDLGASKITKSVELDGHAVTGLAVSPDGSQLAASDGGGHVHLLKWPSLEPAGKIDVGKETAWCAAYVDEGKSLLVGSSDRNLYRCEAKADAKAESIARGSDWITQLAVSSAGQVAAAEVGGRLHFPSTGGSDSMDASSGVWSLCWNGEGQLFAGTRKDGIVIAGRSWKWTEPAPPAKEAPKQEAQAEAAKPAAKKEMKEEQPEKPKEEPKEDSAAKDAKASSDGEKKNE